ncbi:MAG TPA: SDR family NAD(P)-dependent oxidoreductase [Candidatus Thioglobus sp.]|nr:SDR family NAD(P)-dependent oxidoreductase [Candidatus Thioglobus sp.]HIL21199.1 SDR family NAD(P)-dependent oxidoreductase [Candidatus Thioglobus sp.]
MNISLEGKRVFITAGGDGMGRATAIAMHNIGAKVFTCDIDETSLKTLPEGIITFVCDVSKSSNLDPIFEEILPSGLDILVNNAGISGPTKSVEEISDDEWDSCMAVGINAQFYCVR